MKHTQVLNTLSSKMDILNSGYDIRCLRSLEHEASDINILNFINLVDKIRFSRNGVLNGQSEELISVIDEWLLSGKWSLPIQHRLHELIVDGANHARDYNNIWRMGTTLRKFYNCHKKIDIPNFEDNMYDAFQDMLLVTDNDIKSDKKSDLFLEWEHIMSPGFLSLAIEHHPSVFGLLANKYVSNSIAGRTNLRNYASVYKHTSTNNQNIMSYWAETCRLEQADKQKDILNGYSSSIYGSKYGYSCDTRNDSINFIRAFWFKVALRQHLTFDDILKQPEHVGTMLIRSAAYLYMQKSHPMIGNFLKTVIPMLRESIDSGIITESSLTDLNMKMLTMKIESVPLPEDLFDY